jgi:hypothetical protein
MFHSSILLFFLPSHLQKQVSTHHLICQFHYKYTIHVQSVRLKRRNISFYHTRHTSPHHTPHQLPASVHSSLHVKFLLICAIFKFCTLTRSTYSISNDQRRNYSPQLQAHRWTKHASQPSSNSNLESIWLPETKETPAIRCALQIHWKHIDSNHSI